MPNPEEHVNVSEGKSRIFPAGRGVHANGAPALDRSACTPRERADRTAASSNPLISAFILIESTL